MFDLIVAPHLLLWVRNWCNSLLQAGRERERERERKRERERREDEQVDRGLQWHSCVGKHQ